MNPNRKNYENKLNQLKANLNSRGQYQLIYDSFVYQKMAEICFVFFNNKIQSLYSIPPFYNIALDTNDFKRMERLDYYNKDKKKYFGDDGTYMSIINLFIKNVQYSFEIPYLFKRVKKLYIKKY
jgi:hypothetical protein